MFKHAQPNSTATKLLGKNDAENAMSGAIKIGLNKALVFVRNFLLKELINTKSHPNALQEIETIQCAFSKVSNCFKSAVCVAIISVLVVCKLLANSPIYANPVCPTGEVA